MPEIINSIKKMANIEKIILERFMKNISKEISSYALILDIGAGSSPYKNFFKGQHYISTDIAPHKDTQQKCTLDFISDALNMPVKNESVQILINTQMLEHTPSPEEVLNEFYRILKPGGQLFLTAPQSWELHLEPHHYFNFTKYGLELLFKRAGFKIVSIKPKGGYFYFMSNKIRYSSQVIKYYLKGKTRILLYPFYLLHYLIFSLIVPILLIKLDWIDKEKKLTLGYLCWCVKQG